jgi:hypothetical protein
MNMMKVMNINTQTGEVTIEEIEDNRPPAPAPEEITETPTPTEG